MTANGKEKGGNDYRGRDPFFSNREIWEQVFGSDGRGGAIGELHDAVDGVDKKVDEKFEELKTMMCKEFENLTDEVKKHNGVKPMIENLESRFEYHVTDWNAFQSGLQTQQAIDEDKEQEHQRGIDEGDRLFNKRIKLAALYLTGAGIIIGALVRILFF